MCPKIPKCPKSERAEIRTGLHSDYGTVKLDCQISDIHCIMMAYNYVLTWARYTLFFFSMGFSGFGVIFILLFLVVKIFLQLR